MAFLTDVNGFDEVCAAALSCVKPKVYEIVEECLKTTDESSKAAGKNLECEQLSGSELEKCKANGYEFVGEVSDCVLTKAAAMDAAKKIDLEAMKKFALDLTTLTDQQKAAAGATFDGCMSTKYPSPYTPLHYKPENLPAPLQALLPILQKQAFFGNAVPAGSIVAVDCMLTAFIQNGCSTVTQEAVDAALKKMAEEKMN